MSIECNQCCNNQCRGIPISLPPMIRVGPQGPPGPSGGGSCGCISQLRNIIEQIITLFPTSTIKVNFDSGGSASNRPNSLIPAGENSGIFTLALPTGVTSDRINLCRIASIQLTGTDSFFNADGSSKINFLPAPSPAPTGCDADCEAANRFVLQSFLGTGTTVNVTAGGTATGQELVTAVGFGASILGTNTIVNHCLIENIR